MSDWSFGSLFDGLGSTVSDLSSFLGSKTVSGLANTAAAGFDIYSGINAMNRANTMTDLAYATAEKQNAYSDELFSRQKSMYWPIEDKQAAWALEDMNAARGLSTAQRDYAIQKGNTDIATAKELDPVITDTKKSLVRRLAEGEDVLANRMRNTASADVTASFDKQRDSDVRKFGLYGINPNSGMMSNYMSKMGTSQALADAGARTQASRQAEDTSLSRQGQAINYASGIPLSTQQYTPSTTPTAALSGLTSAANLTGNLGSNWDSSASNSFTGASAALKNVYNIYNPPKTNNSGSTT